MFKAMVLLKRKPGMSLEDFIDYYETKHAPLGIKYQTSMKRYIRHYLHPLPYGLTGVLAEPEHDVLTETWFDSREAFDESRALVRAPEANAVLREDEKKLCDLGKNRLVMVEDRESVPHWAR